MVKSWQKVPCPGLWQTWQINYNILFLRQVLQAGFSGNRHWCRWNVGAGYWLGINTVEARRRKTGSGKGRNGMWCRPDKASDNDCANSRAYAHQSYSTAIGQNDWALVSSPQSITGWRLPWEGHDLGWNDSLQLRQTLSQVNAGSCLPTVLQNLGTEKSFLREWSGWCTCQYHTQM